VSESPAEKQYRLASEAECRRVADLIKKELSPRLGFLLVTADFGGGKEFSNTSYVSSVQRDDAVRLLTELLDNWMSRGTGTQPTVKTATCLREGVFAIRANARQRLLHGARCSVRDAESALRVGNELEGKVQLLKLATEALALFDQLESARAEEG
jgi:hypothetical protein